MAEWIPEAEHILKNKFGITVDHAYSGVSFIEQFYKVKRKGNRKGQIYGFPFTIGAWCNDRLKLKAIKKYYDKFKNQTITQFVGIAYDEPKRWERIVEKETQNCKYRSLLFEQKLTEQDAFQICEKYGLLSPIYKASDEMYRGGCWFCPKQCYADLYSLWKNYPNYYSKLIELEFDSCNTFKPNMLLYDISVKFREGYIPKRRKKRQKYMQTDMFSIIDGEIK